MSISTPAGSGPAPADRRHPASGPGAARVHIRRLGQDSGTYVGIGGAACPAPATVGDVASGRRRCTTRGIAAAVLSVTSDAVRPVRVEAGRSCLRLRALHVMGHSSARIARALGVRETTIFELVRGDARTVSPKLRDKIADLYDAWWDKRAPNAPGSSAARPPPPASAPSPGTGAPTPPWRTTSSTSPAAGTRAGNPPPAPASPRHTPARPPPEGPPMTSDDPAGRPVRRARSRRRRSSLTDTGRVVVRRDRATNMRLFSTQVSWSSRSPPGGACRH